MNKISRGYKISTAAGFTLLELLVVLAIVGIMVGVAIFFATPSSLEANKKKGEEVFNMMQKARLRSMMESKIYGLDVEENNIRLVSLITNSDAASYSDGAPSEDASLTIPDNTNNLANEESNKESSEEDTPKPTYEEHKAKGVELGLFNFITQPEWQERTDEFGNSIDFDSDTELEFFKSIDSPQLLNEVNSENPEEYTDELENEINPEILFFPDGRLSANGNMRLVNGEGDIIYGFSWEASGKFEKLNK